jgi:hypothetical protein
MDTGTIIITEWDGENNLFMTTIAGGRDVYSQVNEVHFYEG